MISLYKQNRNIQINDIKQYNVYNCGESYKYDKIEVSKIYMSLQL